MKFLVIEKSGDWAKYFESDLFTDIAHAHSNALETKPNKLRLVIGRRMWLRLTSTSDFLSVIEKSGLRSRKDVDGWFEIHYGVDEVAHDGGDEMYFEAES